MKVKDIAKKYKVPQYHFESYLERNHIGKKTFTGYLVEDEENIPHYVESYLKEVEEEKNAAEAERLAEEQEAQRKQIALSNMLVTSGFTFDGYKITKYSGYISGDDAVQIPRSGWFGGSNTGQKLTDALVQIRRQAIKELKEAAYDLGCNAVIGVDFDYINMDPQTASATGGTLYEPYVICVTANGNAVVIEKEE